MSKWYTRSCDDCGCEINIHEDWDKPPKICKSCKDKRAAKWYEKIAMTAVLQCEYIGIGTSRQKSASPAKINVKPNGMK